MKPPTAVERREALAGVRGLSAADQLRWASDASPLVRRVIAARWDVAAEAARLLAHDRDRQVRQRLAANRGCPADVMIELLDDDAFAVRWGAAQNPWATTEVHLAGLTARHKDVSEAVGQLGDALDPEVIEALLAHPHPGARERLAEVTTSSAVLERLAQDSAPDVRGSVALSQHVTEALLRQLATDPAARVRAMVGAASSTPKDVLTVLREDRSADVRWWTKGGYPDDATSTTGEGSN